MRLLTRYLLANILLMLTILTASGIVLYHFTQVILIREMKADLKGVESKLLNYVTQFHQLPSGFALDEEELSYWKTGSEKTGESAGMATMYSPREKKMHNFMRIDFPVWLNGSWYKVRIAKPLEGMHHLSNALVNISIGCIFLIIVLEVLLNNILVKRMWRPFYSSMAIMREFKLSASSQLQFPPTSIKEFDFMNKSLQLATSKAKQDYLLLKEFTENASHELQTPLSIIRSKLDMLIQESSLTENQSELARDAYRSIRRLSSLNRSLLLLAKIENQQFDNNQQVDMYQKVLEKVDQFKELWQSHEITCTFQMQEPSFLTIDPELLEILLNNLFSNASNHNVVQGHIGITLSPDTFTISNTGSSGPLNEERLYSRFYKTEVNSNQNGLGLSIVKQITRIAGLTIRYKFSENMHSFSIIWSQF